MTYILHSIDCGAVRYTLRCGLYTFFALHRMHCAFVCLLTCVVVIVLTMVVINIITNTANIATNTMFTPILILYDRATNMRPSSKVFVALGSPACFQ
jgi:hypothetical protein